MAAVSAGTHASLHRSAGDSAPASRGQPGWRTGWTVAGLMLVALLVRGPGLGRTNLWLDEANSWQLARYPIHELLANLRASPGSPLYFLLLHGWVQLWGDSERAMRSLSLIVSLALVPLTYSLGTRLVGRRAALIATVLLVCSPLHLYFAQEARVYMLAAVLVTACTSVYVAWRRAAGRADAAATTSRPAAALAAYTVCAVLAVYTLNLAALVLLALNIDAVLVIGSGLRAARRSADARARQAWLRTLSAWALAQLIVLLACAPLVLAMDARTAAASQAWRRALGAGDAVRGVLEYFAIAIHGGYFYPWQLYQAFADRWSPDAALYRVLAYPLTFLVIVTALSLPPRGGPRRPARVAYLTLLLPLAAGAAVSVSHELVLSRYFLFTTPMLYLLIGAGLDRMAPRLRAVSLVVLLATMAAGLRAYHDVAARDSDYRPVARRLGDVVAPGDAILVQPPEMGVPLSYYLGRDARGRGSPPVVASAPAGAPVAAGLVPATGRRTWVVLDYRSRAFSLSADSLRRLLPGAVLSDALATPGGSGVRILEVEGATPR